MDYGSSRPGTAPAQWFIGRSAIVTGAARGIGRGTAELLERLGARVIAVDRDEQALQEAFGEGRFIRLHGDLASEGAGDLADRILRSHGPVELLVNNVGVDTPAHFLELDEDDFDLVFQTNLRGPWFFTRQIARSLVDARRGGAIVFVSSLHDTHVRTFPHYSTSKAAVAMLVKELAHELGPHGIRVNAVSPGSIHTSRNPVKNSAEEANLRERVALGRVGDPTDVARMAAVLLSDEWSGYVTGANVPVDGGLALQTWVTNTRFAPAPSAGLKQALGRVRRWVRRV